MRLVQKLTRLVPFRIVAILAVIGPGFITANVDNDPGGTRSRMRPMLRLRWRR